MRKYILLISKDHYNPLGIVRTLGEAGINPIVVVVKGELELTTKSKYVKEKYFVDTPEDGLELILKKFANNKAKNFILTGDDVTVSLLDKHYDDLKNYFFFYNAGKTGRIREFMEKDNVCKLAKKHGFLIPKTWKVKVGEIPSDICYPVMTKAINSFGKEWKNIVFICNNNAELLKAYKKIHSTNVLIQEYILKKDEQSYEGVSVNKGNDVFFIMQNNEVYHLPDKYAPYWKNRNVDDVSFIKKASAMLKEIGYEGIFEFEFMVNSNDKLVFLEINFRNTANGWSTTVAGMPAVTIWCNSMLNNKIIDNCYKKIPDGFTTMAECFDYDMRVKTGLLSRQEWLREYRNTDAKLYCGRNDIFPFLSFLRHKYRK